MLTCKLIDARWLNTSLLVSLKLCELKSVERLPGEHRGRLLHQHLTLRQLHKLGLWLILKATNAAHRASVDGSALAVGGLEWLRGGMLIHLKVAEVLILRLVDSGRLNVVDALLTPIALEVAGAGPTVTLAATPTEIAVVPACIIVRLNGGELEASGSTARACTHAATGADSHRLATTMPSAAKATPRGRRGLRCVQGIHVCLFLRWTHGTIAC